jgi:hypothetical protein
MPRSSLSHFIERVRKGTDRDSDCLRLSIALGLRSRAMRSLEHRPGLASEVDRIRLELLNGNLEGAVSRAFAARRKMWMPARMVRRLTGEIAQMIAPFSLHKAMALVRSCPVPPDCGPALALELGQVARYMKWASILRDNLGPDFFLLEANNSRTYDDKERFLNNYLEAYGLSAAKRIHSSKPLYVCNLAPSLKSSRKKEEGPLLSVVLTAFNCETYVESAMLSVLDQTYSVIELIVIDDGSTDATWERISTLASQDSRIITARLKRNVGTYAAKNIGLCMAKGDFVAFQDADDWSHPERFHRCVSALLADQQLVAVSALYVRIRSSGQFCSSNVWPLTRWTPNSIVFRRAAAMEKIGYFHCSRFGADSEYVARLRLAFGEARHLKLRIPVIFASQRPNSLMTSSDAGIATNGFSAKRLRYQEEWTESLIEKSLRGETLYRSYEETPLEHVI